MTEHIVKAYEVDIDFRINGFEKANEEGYKVETKEIQPGIIYQDDRVTVEAFPVSHGTLESYGFKFTTPDKVIVISGDTAPLEIVAQKAKAVIFFSMRWSTPPVFPPGSRSGRNTIGRFTPLSVDLAKIAAKAHAAASGYLPPDLSHGNPGQHPRMWRLRWRAETPPFCRKSVMPDMKVPL